MSKADFDLVFDALKSTLETYAAAQVSPYGFTVLADRFRDLPADSSAVIVMLHMGTVSAMEQTVHGNMKLSVPYNLDMIVKARGEKDGAAFTNANEAAGARIRYLYGQLIEALFPSGNYRLGMAAGTIAEKRLDSITPLLPEEIGERGFAAARMVITISTQWEPTPVTGTDIDSISVTADKWSALISP